MLKHELYKPWARDDAWGIEIIDGEFSGTVIQIQSVEFKDDSSGNIQVEYHVINGESSDILNSNPLFVSTFELIINDILKEAVQDYEQNRNNDSKESST